MNPSNPGPLLLSPSASASHTLSDCYIKSQKETTLQIKLPGCLYYRPRLAFSLFLSIFCLPLPLWAFCKCKVLQYLLVQAGTPTPQVLQYLLVWVGSPTPLSPTVPAGTVGTPTPPSPTLPVGTGRYSYSTNDTSCSNNCLQVQINIPSLVLW